MLLNPNLGGEQLRPIPGTRMLDETFGLIGHRIIDTIESSRVWTIQALYSAVRGRIIGGVRAKLTDQKDFVTFCNQRDLEVLLNIGSPGNYCYWLDADYAEPGSRQWIGFCMDEEDLLDDLFDRELWVRSNFQPGELMPDGISISRRVHLGDREDAEETIMLLSDIDHITGYGPDIRFETLSRRWVTCDRTDKHLRSRLWGSL